MRMPKKFLFCVPRMLNSVHHCISLWYNMMELETKNHACTSGWVYRVYWFAIATLWILCTSFRLSTFKLCTSLLFILCCLGGGKMQISACHVFTFLSLMLKPFSGWSLSSHRVWSTVKIQKKRHTVCGDIIHKLQMIWMWMLMLWSPSHFFWNFHKLSVKAVFLIEFSPYLWTCNLHSVSLHFENLHTFCLIKRPYRVMKYSHLQRCRPCEGLYCLLLSAPSASRCRHTDWHDKLLLETPSRLKTVLSL